MIRLASTLTIVALCLAGIPTYAAAEVRFEDVLGKVFYTYGASSVSGLMLITGFKTMSRNTIEISYLTGEQTAPEIVLIDPESPEGVILKADRFMVNCQKRTYTPYAYATDQAALATYIQGAAYKWGDYSKGDFMQSSSQDDMAAYMDTVCRYTAQY